MPLKKSESGGPRRPARSAEAHGTTSSAVRLEYAGRVDAETILTPKDRPPLNPIGRDGSGARYGSGNALICGDNLEVLRALLEDSGLRGKVNLIYIDPPFASRQKFKTSPGRASTVSRAGSGETAYEDALTGPRFLEFLRQRLILLRELLADDGSIYVHIDHHMSHYVRALMDEVFGEENFRNEIARIKCNPKNFERKGYGNVKDVILFYSKSEEFVWNGSSQAYTEAQLERLFPLVDEAGRRYTTNPLHAPGETLEGATGRKWRGLGPPPGRHWRQPPEELEKLDRAGLIEWSRTGNPRKKIFADQFRKKSTKRQDVWEFKDPQYPSYPTEKNLEMLKVIVNASSRPGDIVLDCFAGSGTTLVAAQELGRRWIGIDESPMAVEKTIARLTRLSTEAAYQISAVRGEEHRFRPTSDRAFELRSLDRPKAPRRTNGRRR